MAPLQPLERRILACAYAPHAIGGATETALSFPAVAADPPAYNTAFLTDAQLENASSMTAAEVRAFLRSRNSYFAQAIADADGVSFDPATVIAQAAAQYRISPKVILATLQKEHSGVTRTTRPTDSQMRFLMGCVTPTTARAQLACAAERFRSYQDSLVRTGATVSGWRVGVAKATQDGVSVTPATRAVAGQFTYTPYAGVQWGGNRAGVGGVYLFYDTWNRFGFFDSTRPTASATAPNILATGSSAQQTIRVTFADAAGVDASDIASNNSAVRVTGPNGFSRLATFASLSATTDGTPRTATYRLAAPGGTWDAADAGLYTVRMEEAQVSDVNNNFVAAGAVGTFTVSRPAAVVARHVFYNDSAFDGGDPAADARDDAAIATDKQALRPGQVAGFSNVSGYSQGLNGIMVDVRGLPASATLALPDFDFRAGSGPDPATWATAPAPSSITVRRGAGTGGSDRVTITWPDGAVRNAWLQVTLKANPDKLLASADVFYFGNLPGDAGDPAGGLAVDAADYVATRNNLFTGGSGPTNPYDHDRDGRVDSRDVLVTRANASATLPVLGGAAVTVTSVPGVSTAAADSGPPSRPVRAALWDEPEREIW